MNDLENAATHVSLTLREAGYDTWLVGGCVRDKLLGKLPCDWDIATAASPDQVREVFEHTIPVGESFGVIIVVEKGFYFEVATFRTESGYDGRRPASVQFATLQEDVQRRDFTINGLVIDPLTKVVHDWVGGAEDIKAKIVRTIGDPDKRFEEDHLRMLRAIRFASSLGFMVEEETLASIKRNAKKINNISSERIRDELTKMLCRPNPDQAFRLLAETGLLVEVLPEVDAMRGCTQPPEYHPEGDVWEHTMRMLQLLVPFDRTVCLVWSILLHDVGKPPMRTVDDSCIHFNRHAQEGGFVAERILTRLCFSRKDTDRITEAVRQHMRFMSARLMRPSKLKRFLRQDDFKMWMMLHRLDSLAADGDTEDYSFCLAKSKELPPEVLKPEPLLRGQDLIEMGFVPGPIFKEILTTIEDAQLNGEITDRTDARNMVRSNYQNPVGITK